MMLNPRCFATLMAAACCSIGAAQSFAPAVSQTIAAGAGTPVVGDIDGDGDGDLLYIDDANPASANLVLVVRNDGIGASSLAYALPIPVASSHTLAAGDIDGDGDLDIVTCNQTSFTVLRNTGTGVTQVDTSLGGVRSRVTLADFDGDGDLDLVFDAHEVWYNDGAGNFSAPLILSLFPNPVPGLIARLTDFDGDGDLDFVCAWSVPVPSSFLYPNGSNDLWVGTFRQDPGATFTTILNGLAMPNTRAAFLELVDLDGDGDRDMVLGFTFGVGQPVTFSGGSASSVFTADVTGGTIVPIITGGQISYLLPWNALLAVGDVDGDGTAEILAVGPESFQSSMILGALIHVSSAGYSIRQYVALPTMPWSVTLARVDANPSVDLVAMSGNPANNTSTLTIRRNVALAAPISLTKASGDNQFISYGPATFPVPFVVHLADGNGAPLAGREVYFPRVVTPGPVGSYVSTQSYLVTTNANGDASVNPGIMSGGPFLLTGYALDQSVQFNCYLRRLAIGYNPAVGSLFQSVQSDLANEPLLIAYDTTGWSVPTPYGTVKTGILAGPAVTTVFRDGIGAFGPPDPTMIGNASGIWSRTDLIPANIRNSGIPIVLQMYAVPGSAPWFVSNAVTVTL